MENNNMNEQQTNWQQALNEFSDQPQQPVSQAQPQQYTQQVQPQQFAQQGQPQFNQYAQQAQPQQFAQQGKPQFNQYAQQAQFAQADGQFTQQVQPGMPAYDAGSFAVVPPKKNSALKIILIVLAAVIVVGGIPLALYFAGVFGKSGGGYETIEKNYFAAAEKKADEIFGGAKNIKTGIEQTFTISASLSCANDNSENSVAAQNNITFLISCII